MSLVRIAANHIIIIGGAQYELGHYMLYNHSWNTRGQQKPNNFVSYVCTIYPFRLVYLTIVRSFFSRLRDGNIEPHLSNLACVAATKASKASGQTRVGLYSPWPSRKWPQSLYPSPRNSSRSDQIRAYLRTPQLALYV